MESNLVCNHTSISSNKIGRQRSRSPICQSLVWLQTELDDTNSCYQLIITITSSETKRRLGQTSFSNLEISKSFFQGKWSLLVWLCDQLFDWWILLSGLSMIGCFNCPITGVRIQPTALLQLYRVINDV